MQTLSALALSSTLLGTNGIRLPFPVDIPEGETELKIEGNLIDWLRDNGVQENDPNALNSETGPSSRFGLTLTLPFLTKYGCWCYRGSDYPAGKGYPRDDFDAACKRMHMGYDCIVSDSFTDEPNCQQDAEGNYVDCCQPESTSYTWYVVPNFNSPGDYMLECGDDITQGDWCKANTCSVDLRFMTEYWALTAYGAAPDFESYGHPDGPTGRNSTFDTSVCPFVDDMHIGAGNGGGGTVTTPAPMQWDTKQCCGDFPYRFWFYTMDDGSVDRECCLYEDLSLTEEYNYSFNSGAMYHTLRQECCEDGVGSIGSCP